jgi:hypothetical protein
MAAAACVAQRKINLAAGGKLLLTLAMMCLIAGWWYGLKLARTGSLIGSYDVMAMHARGGLLAGHPRKCVSLGPCAHPLGLRDLVPVGWHVVVHSSAARSHPAARGNNASLGPRATGGLQRRIA